VLETTLIFSIFVLSVYPLSGLTGLFSLGQGAFIAIGAYTAAIGTLQYKLPPAISMVLAIGIGILGGVIVGVPTLKLRRDYFLLITFGFSEMVRALLLWMAQLTGGAMGIAGIPYAAGLPLIAVSAAFIFFLVANITKSGFRRNCIAIRDDELAAQAIGINVYWHKIKVFILSASISAYGGALYAFNMMFIEPNLFDWLESAKLIIIIFVGGMNSLLGVFLMSVIYYTFGEVFRFASIWRDLILGVLVIVVLIFRPQGLFGTMKKK